MYDVIILGAGPAGVTAGLYAHRFNRKTLIIYNQIANIEKAEKIENYYGFKNGISGNKLYNDGIAQAKNIGIKVKTEEILQIDKVNNIIEIVTDKNRYATKTLIIAIGNKKRIPNIKGIQELEGRGISYCAKCDGFFFKNKNVAVLGSGKYAISETNDLVNIANKVTILTNGENSPEIRADNVTIITKLVESINGEGRVQNVQFSDGNKLEIDGIFIAEGILGNKEISKKMGIIMKNDYIQVNDKMETNINGVYACGDCTGGILQISKAIYEGMIAGMQANKYIMNGGK